MINIQHDALCAFKQDAMALAAHIVQFFPNNACIRQQFGGNFFQFRNHLYGIDRGDPHAFQQGIVVG